MNYSMVKVYINNYPNESDLTGTDSSHGNRPYVLVPMPKANPQGMFIEGDGQNGADPSRFSGGGSDSHMIVWDADTDTAYEMWEASRPSESAAVPSGYYISPAISTQWNAANEATWHMNADSFRTLGYTSADAAGLPILNNIARPDEVLPAANGGQSTLPVINHALRFTLPRGLISHQYTYPASHVAGGGGTIPYGARFRLKNDAATNALIAKMGPESQVIAHALQQYGLILADIGSSMFIQGAATSVDTNNNPIVDPTTGKPITWNMNDLTPDQMPGQYTVGLDSIPTSDFEAVNLTPTVTGLSASSGSAGTTITVTGNNFLGAAGHLSVLFVPPGNSPPYTSNGQVTTLKPGVVAATTVTIVDNQHLSVVVPQGAGTVDIEVLSGQLLDDTYNSDAENATAPIFGYGLSAPTSADQFTYSTSNVAPAITTQPTNQAVSAGQTATFTAAASGTPTPTVQWQLSTDGGSTWSNIVGATSTSYKVANATASQSGYEYRAVFTNGLGTATTKAATLTINVAPTITKQPTGATVVVGQKATFTASAGGTPTPTVQWQVSRDSGAIWTNVTNATATTFTLTSTTNENGDEFRAVFTNSAGQAISSPATLTLAPTAGPTITSQPVNQTVAASQTVTFTASAGGSPPPTIQWQVSTNGGSTWTNIAGTYATTLTVTAASTLNGNRYRAVFSNNILANGDYEAATLVDATTGDVLPFGWLVGPPNPASLSKVNVSTATDSTEFLGPENGSQYIRFQSAANNGSRDCLYQDLNTVAGQTYTVSFWVAITSTSVGNTLELNPVWDENTSTQKSMTNAFYTSPSNTAPIGYKHFVFTETASSSKTRIDFHGIDANGSILVDNVSVVATATTNSATLTVTSASIAPIITTQPTNQTVTAGQSATFTAAASGTPNPTVQWQLSTNGGSTWSNITGATSSTCTVANTTTSQNGYEYRAVFSNSAGSATTNAAILTVNSSSGNKTATFQEGVAGYAGGEDAGIDTQYAIYNGGNGVQYLNQPSLGIGIDSQGSVFETLFRFNALTIPTNATVSSASLTVTMVDWVGGTTVTGYYVNNAWSTTDGTIGWLHRGGGANWATPGALGQGTDLVASKSFTLPTTTASGPQVFTLNHDPSVVQNWVSHASTDQGFLLVVKGSGIAYLDTAENTNVTSRPMLSVTYSTPGMIASPGPGGGHNTTPKSAASSVTNSGDVIVPEQTTATTQIHRSRATIV